jgi:hypothetical protein
VVVPITPHASGTGHPAIKARSLLEGDLALADERSVSRIEGQLPSPTPMMGTSLDSISVMWRSG